MDDLILPEIDSASKRKETESSVVDSQAFSPTQEDDDRAGTMIMQGIDPNFINFTLSPATT